VGGGPKMSMAQSCQGPEGGKVLVIGSGLLNSLFTWHPWQVLQRLSASLSIPGHQTFMQSILFVFTIPWWPSCASFSTRLRSCLGMMMRVPRGSKLPWLHSSCRTGKYSLHEQFDQSPVWIHCRSSTSSGSFFRRCQFRLAVKQESCYCQQVLQNNHTFHRCHDSPSHSVWTAHQQYRTWFI